MKKIAKKTVVVLLAVMMLFSGMVFAVPKAQLTAEAAGGSFVIDGTNNQTGFSVWGQYSLADGTVTDAWYNYNDSSVISQSWNGYKCTVSTSAELSKLTVQVTGSQTISPSFGTTYYIAEDGSLTTTNPATPPEETFSPYTITVVPYGTGSISDGEANVGMTSGDWATKIWTSSSQSGEHFGVDVTSGSLVVTITDETVNAVYIGFNDPTHGWLSQNVSASGAVYYVTYEGKLTTDPTKVEPEVTDPDEPEVTFTPFNIVVNGYGTMSADTFACIYGESTANWLENMNSGGSSDNAEMTIADNVLTLTIKNADVGYVGFDFKGDVAAWVGDIPAVEAVYYLHPDGTLKTEAPEMEEPAKCTLTVNYLGEAAWLLGTFHDGDTWPVNDGKTAEFAADGEWLTATINTIDTSIPYSSCEFCIGADSADWSGTKYDVPLTEGAATVWMVEGISGIFATKEEALAAQSGGAAEDTTIIVHYKSADSMSGWCVGYWYENEDGTWTTKDADFTYTDSYGYVAVIEIDSVPSEVGFKIHRRAYFTTGGTNNWYKEDVSVNRKIAVTNGFAEVWLEKGSEAVDTNAADKEIFDQTTATEFKNNRYVTIKIQTTADPVDAHIVIHYARKDGDYDKWGVGIWGEVSVGKWKDETILFKTDDYKTDPYGKELLIELDENGFDEDGYKVAIIPTYGYPVKEIGFKLHQDNWLVEDEWNKDRYIDITGLKDDDILHVYVYEGEEEIFLDEYDEKLHKEFFEETVSGSSVLGAFFSRSEATASGSSNVVAVFVTLGVILAAAGTTALVWYLRKSAKKNEDEAA